MSRINGTDLSDSSDTLSRPYHRYWDQLFKITKFINNIGYSIHVFLLRCLLLYESKVGVMREDYGIGGCGGRECRKGGCD